MKRGFNYWTSTRKHAGHLFHQMRKGKCTKIYDWKSEMLGGTMSFIHSFIHSLLHVLIHPTFVSSQCVRY